MDVAAAAGGRFVIFHYISAVRLDARPCRVNCKQKRPLQASIAPAADWMSKLLLTKKTSEQSELCSDVSFVAEKDTARKALRLNGFAVLRILYFCFSALFSSHFRTPILTY